MIELTMDAKNMFVDFNAINRAVDRQKRKATVRSLFVLRRRSIQAYRRRKRVSSSGQSPSVHSKNPVASLKNILFAYEQATDSGVVGPVKLRNVRSTATSSQSVPGLLESGGVMTVSEVSLNDGRDWLQTRRSLRVSSKNARYRKRTVRIAKRPAMAPTLSKAIADGVVVSPWTNVVTG